MSGCGCMPRLWSGSKDGILSYEGMSSSNAEHYRARAEECCRKAILAEDVDKRSHWLEAAARWFSLGREEGALPQRQTSQERAN